MKRFFLTWMLAAMTLLPAQAADLEWLTDLPKALALAKEEKKPVLIDFTGSDWCAQCIKLDQEVLSKKEFADYAKSKFVLVKLDHRIRTPQLPAEQKANAALREEYKIEGFPTLVVLNSDGKELGREEGYSGNGPAAVIAKLDRLRAK